MDDSVEVESRQRYRRRRNWTLGAVAFVLASVLIILTRVAWWVAGRDAAGTEGLVAQMQMLLAVLQGFLGSAIVLATIAYAMRTGEMVDRMDARDQHDRRRDVEAGIDRLAAAAFDVVTSCGPIGDMQARSTSVRWRFGRRLTAVEALLVQAVPRAGQRLSDALAASEALADMAPLLRLPADAVVTTTSATLDAALDGDVAVLPDRARAVREAVEAVRAALAESDRLRRTGMQPGGSEPRRWHRKAASLSG